MNKLPSLSFFMPCFNEESNVEIAIKEAYELLPKVANKWELIIVNDGSSDNSLEILEKVKKKYKDLKIVNHNTNLGYGAALKSGFNKAKYEWIFFTDSDLQFDMNQLIEFIKYFSKYSVIIGYRKKRAEGFKRAFNMFLYKIVVDIFFNLKIRDIDCAFKLFKSNIVRDLKLKSNGAFLSTELMYKIKMNKEIIKEIPVIHKKRRYGNPTGASLKVIFRALRDLLNFYIGQVSGNEN